MNKAFAGISNLAFSIIFFFFSSRRRHTRCSRDWSSDVCSSDLAKSVAGAGGKWKFDKEHRFLFVDKIFGGAIPKEFIPPIEVGIREAMDSGPLEIGRASCRERV